MSKKRLGRGIDRLITGINVATVEEGEKILQVSVEDVLANPFQPRKTWDENAIEELMNSIRENGVLQPILVRSAGSKYEIIAGERRWRASRRLGLKTIPAIQKVVSDQRLLELALIENVQREDLNPIEQAQGYRELMARLGITQEVAARRVGKSRTAVANFLRLLRLPEEIQEFVSRGTITMGHAMSILSLKSPSEQKALAKTILRAGMSVREAENLARKAKAKPRSAGGRTPFIVELEETLQRALGTKVRIKPGRRGGKIVIDYYSNDDFERILDVIGEG